MTDHFATLGEDRRPWLEAEALKEKFHHLSTAVHPDRVHGLDEAARGEAGARYMALNAAYQCLREPKLRLQHLLELERGAKPGDLKSIPDDVVQLFTEVGSVLRQTGVLLGEKASTQSPIMKVQLLEKAMPHLDQIGRLQSAITARREGLLTDLRELDHHWAARLANEAGRGAALAEGERLYHLFGFFDRWVSQLQERMVQLTI